MGLHWRACKSALLKELWCRRMPRASGRTSSLLLCWNVSWWLAASVYRQRLQLQASKEFDLLAGQSNSHPDADKAEFRGWTAYTSRGDISARHVLLATNAYTSQLRSQFADIIVPAKGQVSSLKQPLPPQPAKDPLDIGHTFYFVSDLTDRKDDYLAQRPPPGAELIYGGGCIHGEGHELGEWDESTIDESVGRYLKYELSSLMDLSIHEQGNAQGEHGVHSSKQDIEPTF